MRVCGRGGALTNAPLAQSKSYFEVKIQQSGVWGIGLATQYTDLNTTIGGHDAESWALNSDGIIRHNRQELHKIQNPIQEGDIIVSKHYLFAVCLLTTTRYFCTYCNVLQGVAYDHIELNLYLNGKSLEAPVMGIKGTIYPILYGKYFVMLRTIYIWYNSLCNASNVCFSG